MTRVVSFSGIDGAGKSSQARWLAEELRARGVQPVIYWLPLGHHGMQRLARRLKRGFRARAGSAAAPKHETVEPGGGGNGLLRRGWTLAVAIAYVLSYRTFVLRHGGRGRVVIFDRYVLDACAQMRYFYGGKRDLGFERRLLTLLAPRAQSYFLDVPPEIALARKREQFDHEQLELQVRLLREDAERLGVTRLNGDAPPDQLRERILADVVRALVARGEKATA
jgi:thymidylate kinase